MRFNPLAVLLLAAPATVSPFSVSPSSGAFTPRKNVFHTMAQTRKVSMAAATISMFAETSGGMEELHEIAQVEGKNAAVKVFRKSPSLWKIAGYASIPVSAALGFGLVPSSRMAAHAVGAVVTGVAGAVGKNKLDSALTDSCSKPAIAQALIDAFDGGYLEDHDRAAAAVSQVQLELGVLDEDFETFCEETYTQYLLGMVKFQPQPKTSELQELENIKAALGLTNLQMGEAHLAAAKQWYRNASLFTTEEDFDDPENPERMAMDKILFLSERAFRQSGETEEAFNFEMTRVAKAMDLDLYTSLDRVASVIEPFYQRALKSTRSKLGSGQVSSTMLERARKTLGIADDTAFDMNVACFDEEVQSLLGMTEDSEDVDMATLKFQEGAMERLEELQQVLGLSDTDVEYEITSEATPLYQATALKAMQDVLAGRISSDAAWEVMDSRREELLLTDESSKNLVSSMVMQALGGPLEETMKFAKVNNEAATYDHLLEALEAKEALIAILTKSGWDEFDNFDNTFCNPRDKKSANGFLLSEDRVKLYRMFLNRSVLRSESGRLTDEVYEKIMEVKGLLGITDEQAEIEARSAFGPELQKVLQRCMAEIVEDYTPALAENLKKELDEVMESYRLKEDFLREVGASFYARAVSLTNAKAPSGIPTTEMNEALTALRELYQISVEDTYPAHIEYFGSVYRKSLLEAMGSTGVIRPEFRDALNDLRDRLGVSEDSCKKIFIEAIEEKMKPMIEWVVSEMERTMLTQKQLSQRRGKDMGEDMFQTGKGATGVLGLGADVNLMSDIMEVIDFYTENDVAEKKEIGTTDMEGETEEVPVYETTFPVTALGSGYCDQESAELLYRQFVVGGFTAQGPQAERYEAGRATFGGILGLSSEKMEEINSNIGDTVYDNLIGNAMRTKGTLDQQDMMFLATVQGKLGLTSEQSEKMLLATQKKILSEEISVIMEEPTPEKLKMFREKCNGMGVSIVEDVGVSEGRLNRMFESEITPGLKSGEINAENFEMVTDVTESYGIEAELAEAWFENVILRLSKNAIGLINAELLRGREENTVDLIKEVVRYAAFTEGELDIQIDEATAYQIYNIYEKLDLSDESAEAVEGNKVLLKQCLGL